MTTAQIDTIIANLTATYTELSAKLATTITTAGRSAVFQQLQTVRTELEQWEARKQTADDAGSGATPGVAYVRFVNPA